MKADDFVRANAERARIMAMPIAEREAWLAAHRDFKLSDHSDLSHAQWRTYERITREQGTGPAFAYAEAIRRAAWRPTPMPSDAGLPPLFAATFLILMIGVGIVTGLAGVALLGAHLIW